MLTEDQNRKLLKLKEIIKDYGSIAVGYSGGVDSTFLLTVAHEVLGDKVIAVTEADASVPAREIKESEDFCKEHGIRQILCKADPFSLEAYRNNSPDRCYHCKRLIFSNIIKIAEDNDIKCVAEGSNTDDLGDYRPGLRAVTELSIKSPLREAGLGKEDIRMISKEMGLTTWSKPSYACLASRFVYGEEITEEKLLMIDKAEQFLIENGFINERVRLHGNLARIEVLPEDIERITKEDMRTNIYDHFKELGFMYVTLDLKGYRTGSMNESLS